jgi:hypothetical protein
LGKHGALPCAAVHLRARALALRCRKSVNFSPILISSPRGAGV